MGSGKSTVGHLLSDILDFNFIDLDLVIEEKEQKSINEIFELKGELYFRKKEIEYLQEILQNKSDTVLALGGGTPCYGKNLEAILTSPNTISFYLKTSIAELLKRLRNEKQSRPLLNHLKSDEELLEYLGKHLFERSPFYSKANHVISTDAKSYQEIIEEIVIKLV